MCAGKWAERKNIVETFVFGLGGMLGAIWLIFSFSADKPLVQTFVSKNLYLDMSLESSGVVSTNPPAHAIDIVLNVSNNGKGTMSVLSGLSTIWGVNFQTINNTDSVQDADSLSHVNILEQVNDRLYLGDQGLYQSQLASASTTLLSTTEALRDWVLEPGEPAKRVDTVLVPCGAYDALYAEVTIVAKPTSKKWAVIDDPSKEQWTVYWQFKDENKPIYAIKDRKTWEKETECIRYADMNYEDCKKMRGIPREKYTELSNERIREILDNNKKIINDEDIRFYEMSYTKLLSPSLNSDCKLR
jgi:hypothetical protein